MSNEGPYADDLVLGSPLPSAPPITIDSGIAAIYQAITGDSLRLPSSQPDSKAVTGETLRLVNPGLVLQIAIGQSTVATRLVIANLLYRDVALRRQVHLDDTLTTTVTPTALELTRPGPRRRAKVLLRIETVDQAGRTVAIFERLALLPCRNADLVESRGTVGAATVDQPISDYVPFVPSTWNLRRFAGSFTALPVPATDPLTQNQAAAHRDATRGVGGNRLVYGGHSIGLAQASLSRMVPGLVTVLGWRSCDHLVPVFEGDALEFQVEHLDRLPVADGAAVAGFRVVATARSRHAREGGRPVPVLDWRPVVLLRTVTNDTTGTSS